MSGAARATRCRRCGVRCQAGAGSSAARLLRRAVRGLCANCATADVLKRLTPLGRATDVVELEPLRQPHIQAQFAALLRAGHADAAPDEIDWEMVIANWSLPA